MTLLKGRNFGLFIFVIAVMCMAWTQSIRAQIAASEDVGGWMQLSGTAIDVSINAQGQAYILDDKGTPWRWDAVEQRWRRMSNTFVRITAAEGNRPWAINRDGVVYRYNGLWWEDKDTDVADVAADAVGNVYISKYDGTIHKWNPLRSEWRKISGDAWRLALDASGNPWVVTGQGHIRSYDGEKWTSYPGMAVDVAIGGNGTAVIADAEGQVRVWSPQSHKWTLEPGVVDVSAVAATPNGKPWALSTGGRIMVKAHLVSPEKIKTEKGKAKEIHAKGIQAPVAVAGVPVPPSSQASVPQPSNPTPSAPQAEDANAPVEQASTPQAKGGSTQQTTGRNIGNTEVPTVGVSSASDSSTSSYTGKLTFVNTRKSAATLAIGADGSVFGLDTGGNVLRWSNDKERFDSFPGTLARIAVDSDGNPWGISALGRVFHHDGSSWKQIQNVTASDIAIGFDGSVIIADASDLLHKLNNAKRFFSPIKGSGASVAVASDGTPWTIRDDNLVQRCDAIPCKVYAQKAISIAAGPDGSIWVVSTDNHLMRLKATSTSFEKIQTPGHTPRKVAVGPNGYPWVVSTDKTALASAFFERDETNDSSLALSTTGNTTGSGETSSVSSSSTSAFTFSKNMKFDDVIDTGFKTVYDALVESDPDGVIWAYNYNQDSSEYSQIQYYDSRRKKFVDADTKLDAYLLQYFEVESEDLIWGVRDSDDTLFREKNGVVKQYTPHSSITNYNAMDLGPDGTLYVSISIGDSNRYLYYKSPDSEVFKRFSTYTNVRDVAVGPGDDIWIMGDNLQVMRWTGSKFEEPGNSTFNASSIAISKVDSTVYAKKNGTTDLYKWNATNKDFDKINNISVSTFDVDGDGRPWICCGSDSNDITVSKARD
ncbi:hypothetical protein JCM17960_16850 [Magnetospira thiophila]